VADAVSEGNPREDRRKRPGRWYGFILPVAILLFWEVAAQTGLAPRLLFPAPSQVFRALVRLTASGELPMHMAISLRRIGFGFAAGALPGIVLGLAMGWSPAVRVLADPTVAAMYSIPRLALFPLLIIVFGLGEPAMVALVALGMFFPTLINSMAGVRSIHEMYFEVAQSYGAGAWKVLTRVVLPGSLPMVFTGLRLALGHSLVLVIGAEFISARNGIGGFLWVAWETFRTVHVYAGLVVSALFGIVFTTGLRHLERRLLPWAEGLLHR